MDPFSIGVATGVYANILTKGGERAGSRFVADRWEQADELTRLFWLLEGAFGDELPSFTRKELKRNWGSNPAFLAVHRELSAGVDASIEHEALVDAIEPLVEPTKTETSRELAERVAAFIPYLLPEAKKDSQRVLFELRQVRNLIESQYEGMSSQLDRIEAAVTPKPDLERYIDRASHRRIQDAADRVVGREWVFREIDGFASRHTCGYLRIVAAAGLGKSALAAAIARRYRAPAFFTDAAAGLSRPEQCLNHLSAELIYRFQLAHDRIPDYAGENSGFISRLLEEATAASRQQPVWLVIDALDEAERLSIGANPMLLPQHLPRGVLFVLTHQYGDYSLRVEPGVAQVELEIHANDPRQTEDVRTYLHSQATRNDAVRKAREATNPPLSTDAFVDLLADGSEGNFMYLAFVLADAERDPHPLDLRNLPQGLHDYYQRMWTAIERSSERDWETWDKLHRPVIERLAVAGEAVSAAWLADQTQRSAEEVTMRSLRYWERFLEPEGTPSHRVWRLVHQSFRDFLAAKLDLRAAHRAVADYYLLDAPTAGSST